MKNTLLLIMFFTVGLFANCQSISKAEFKKELQTTISFLSHVHANPFGYQTEEGLSAIKDSILHEYQSQDSISLLKAYQCYSNMVSSIKCAHSGAYKSKALDATIHQFPMDLKIIDDKGFVNQDYSTFQAYVGDQIVSINGIAWTTILTQGKRLHSSDGNSPLTRSLFEKRVRLDIPVILGNPSSFDIKILRVEDTINLSLSADNQEIKQDKSPKFHLCITGPNKDIGVIKISNFPSDKASIAKFEKFCIKTRNKLDRKKINDVIIDIRNNGGGDRIDLLLRNFTPKSFKLMSSSTIDTTNLSKYQGRIQFNGVSYEEVMKIPSNTQQSRQVEFQGDLFLNVNLFVLVNGRTASAASHFASLVKEHELGEIAGKETGGRASGCNGNIYGSYFLPHSNIEIYLPLMKNTYAVDQELNPDHGVIPDILISEELLGKMELTHLIEVITSRNKR